MNCIVGMRIRRKQTRTRHKRSRRPRRYTLRGGNAEKKHYHIYNRYHYGDNIFNLKLFFGIVDILKQQAIVIHYYYDPSYIKNVDELQRYVNPEVVILEPLDKKPADSYDMWMGHYDNAKIETAMSKLYSDALRYLKIDNLGINTSIYQQEDYLLDIYSKLDPKFKDVYILILNNQPMSGQFPYDKANVDAMCLHVASKFKNVVVISPVGDIPCTLTDGLKLQDIGAISTHAKYIIGFNSGPVVPCFNIHTKKSVKKWILFDRVNTVLHDVKAVMLKTLDDMHPIDAEIDPN